MATQLAETCGIYGAYKPILAQAYMCAFVGAITVRVFYNLLSTKSDNSNIAQILLIAYQSSLSEMQMCLQEGHINCDQLQVLL
jgi:hypothetical protein